MNNRLSRQRAEDVALLATLFMVLLTCAVAAGLGARYLNGIPMDLLRGAVILNGGHPAS